MDYEKAYKAVLQTAKQWIKDGCTDKEKICLECVFPELRESEDERIRKEIIEFIQWSEDRGMTRHDYHQAKRPAVWLAYLEKQKEPHYTKRNALFDKCVENCDPKTVEEVNKRVDDIMNMSELSAFEQALTNFIGDWEDDEERWPSKFVKKHGKHILDMAKEELQKEQKPILEVFGFKVGDAVRLKDGDGRKHIIKSFEEVEGIHGPNFYHVEFEDNSARDGIYPGEEYPNGYYTQMEKIEEEQKLAEWSEEDEKNCNRIIRFLEPHKTFFPMKETKEEMQNWLKNRLKSLRPSWKPSEEQLEVDLEKETKQWWKEHLHLNPENQLWMDAHQSVVFARHFYELGKQTMKEQMLKDAVEGIAHPDDCEIWVNLVGYGYKFNDGDKVKLIIVKDDER